MANTAPVAPAAHPAPAAPAAGNNHNPHPAPAHPPTPMTWQGALERILAVAATAAGALLGDWLPALIIMTVLLAPFLHPRTRPLAMGFLGWLRSGGVDTVALMDRVYSWTVPEKLKSWLWLALGFNVGGWIIQVVVSAFLGEHFDFVAIALFTITLVFVGLLYLGALASIWRTRQTPSRADVQIALASPQGFDWFVQTFGRPSSPIFALVALFTGATIIATAHAYYIAAIAGHALAYRVSGAAIAIVTVFGAGIAFQVVFYAITKLGAMALAFVARPIVAVGRAGLVAAVPGITPQNQDAMLGAATTFQGLVGYAPYVLLVGAFGLAHIALALALDVPQLLIMSGLAMIALIGLYCGHAMGKPQWGIWGAVVVGAIFLLRALYGFFYGSYWRTVEGMSVTHGGAFTSSIVANVIAAIVIGGIIYGLFWLITRNRVVALIPALLVVALAAPWLVGNVKKVANPTLATPREQQGMGALEDAAQNTIARGGQALANGANRRTNEWVNPTPPAPAEYNPPPAPEPRRYRGHRRIASATPTCVRYTGPGVCNGMCQSYVTQNPGRCGTQ